MCHCDPATYGDFLLEIVDEQRFSEDLGEYRRQGFGQIESVMQVAQELAVDGDEQNLG
jgi:hypothetical protein